MRIVVTGTPGTGKTTATERLDRAVVHLNDRIRAEGLDSGTDERRGSLVADMDAVAAALDEGESHEIELVESHLAHRLPADRVVVLRCHPDELGERLTARGESEETIAENRESEALDVILSEAVEEHGIENVYEIDATERDPDDVASEIERVVAGEREPSAGTVSFLDTVSL
ncbi:adenylate kinase family protein [Halococcus thailandensis]|uniref:Putative adenylate kinase n=1 Tax=Halococcus thailandensis JCM 13552 TaxID=1227457 RepID=M0N0T2_9EURY|nr:adenylate kinase family protein [Halococcus thailandensis]EMA51461.1 putative nucleotide kinase [Halococcus thailandensis JCM 13552]